MVDVNGLPNTEGEGNNADDSANSAIANTQGNEGGADGGNTEPTYEINYKGQVEKLPLSKVISYAQQGRDYSEKMGKFNEQLTTEAQKLADAAFEKWLQENNGTPKPTEDGTPKPDEEELDEFTKLANDVKAIKEEKQKAEFEKEVSKEVEALQKTLAEVAKEFPLANQRVLLATYSSALKSNPNVNIKELAAYEHKMAKLEQEKWEKDYLEKAKARGSRGAEGAGGAPPAMPSTKVVLGKNSVEAAISFMNSREQK